MTVEENKQKVRDECAWFNANRARIIAGHSQEWVVIRDHQVEGYFPNTQELFAYMDKSGAEPGSYAVQCCLTVEEEIEAFSFLRR
jgi:hypothetical protein